ncbi:hypothetical protein PSTT_05215 [Puccinia striiformis]|uniref:Uncharacterized protein n=1 Tax=Puccinia striiformis TaxID=27350 RepID=A0A2S4VPH9_9BASI|nr:hypothetical protein PSTT_05215 [Puccinia striiformis]
MAPAPISPSPHQTPSRPPSRQSTRNITPVRADPNFVRPHTDLRKTITRLEGSLARPTLDSPANSTLSCFLYSKCSLPTFKKAQEV